jgi:ATP-dependent RNA helicase DDX24/MAK5
MVTKRSVWKPVDVSLPDPGSDVNHYDSGSSGLNKAAAKKDLEARSSESVGMFFGLEVLDGSMYEVNNNRMTIKYDTVDDKEPNEVFPKTKKQKRKEQRAKKQLGKPDNDAGDADAPSLPEAKQAAHEEAEEDENPAKKSKKEANKKKGKVETQIVMVKDKKQAPSTEEDPEGGAKKKPKKKKNKNQTEPPQPEEEIRSSEPADPEMISALQTSWMIATGGVTLKEGVCEGLIKQDFQGPTPIQAATLPAAILGRRNIVGAAPTGSGKTLAYVLPILQHILELTVDDEERQQRPLQALILAPTRELALQVAHECEKLMPRITGTIVGGLAPHKQVRILEKRKPPIVIGTPGRLWQLVSSFSICI